MIKQDVSHTSSHNTSPTSPLWRTDECSLKVSYEIIRIGFTGLREYVCINPSRSLSILSLEDESITKAFTRPDSHLLISLYQFCNITIFIQYKMRELYKSPPRDPKINNYHTHNISFKWHNICPSNYTYEDICWCTAKCRNPRDHQKHWQLINNRHKNLSV